MAKFQLGAIITGIKGSIGGTTFRQEGSSNIIQNKSRGASRSKLLQNKALNRMASIFQQYTLLSDTDKTAWTNASLLYQFPDKFGVLRNLKPRQLFIKLTSQFQASSPDPVDVSTISSVIDVFNTSTATWDLSLQALLLSVAYNSATTVLLVQVETSIQPLRAPTFIAREIIGVIGSLSPYNLQLNANMSIRMAGIGTNYNCRLYITAMNQWGFRSVPLVVPMQVVA